MNSERLRSGALASPSSASSAVPQRGHVVHRSISHSRRALCVLLQQHRSPFPNKAASSSNHPGLQPGLERRQALSLGCSERQVVPDIVNTLTRGFCQGGTGSRLRVAVDVDEVLGRFVFSLNTFCKEIYGMDYDVDDYHIYEFAKIWGCTTDESNHIVHEFFKSKHFNEGIPVIPGAYETLQRLRTHCDLVVVTSRQHVIQDVTLEWIDRHYGGLFQDVYFGNHFALTGTSRKKSDICRSIGAHVLVDDNPQYALDCAEAGLQVLLYDWQLSYPWSKLPPGAQHPNITVVTDWRDVEERLLAHALALAQQ